MNTRRLLLVSLLLGVFYPSVAFADSDECPDLVGTWDFVSGETDSEKGNYSTVEFDSEEVLVIETQNGCLFEGYKVYKPDDGVVSEVYNETWTIIEGFSGVVAGDGKTLYFIDYETGVGFGELVSPTEMTLYYMQHFNAIGEDNSMILVYHASKLNDTMS